MTLREAVLVRFAEELPSRSFFLTSPADTDEYPAEVVAALGAKT